MTDKQIYILYGESTNYKDPDAFASDALISLLDPDEPGQDVDMAMMEPLLMIWHIANDSFRDFLSLIGLNQTQCSNRFCIPLRTVQDWARGVRTPPPYVRLMMAELSGIIDIRD